MPWVELTDHTVGVLRIVVDGLLKPPTDLDIASVRYIASELVAQIDDAAYKERWETEWRKVDSLHLKSVYRNRLLGHFRRTAKGADFDNWAQQTVAAGEGALFGARNVGALGRKAIYAALSEYVAKQEQRT